MLSKISRGIQKGTHFTKVSDITGSHVAAPLRCSSCWYCTTHRYVRSALVPSISLTIRHKWLSSRPKCLAEASIATSHKHTEHLLNLSFIFRRRAQLLSLAKASVTRSTKVMISLNLIRTQTNRKCNLFLTFLLFH